MRAMTKARWWVGAALAFTVTAAGGDAAAQGFTPDSHRTQVGAWTGWWSTEKTLFSGGTVWPTVHFGSIRIVDAAQIDIDVPTSMWIDGPAFPDREFRAGVGNPTIGARYAPITGIVAWSVGGRLGLPVATIDDPDFQIASAVGLVAMAGYDIHLWAPNYMPFGITGGVDIQPVDALSIFFDVEPTFMVPLRDPNEFEFVLQTRAGIDARHPTVGFGGGFAIPVVIIPTSDNGDLTNDDAAQLSFDAWLSYTHDVFFVRLGNILALDEPFGFGFDQGKVWTAYLKLGAFFDGQRRPR
jgi:hypothetical protein